MRNNLITKLQIIEDLDKLNNIADETKQAMLEAKLEEPKRFTDVKDLIKSLEEDSEPITLGGN